MSTCSTALKEWASVIQALKSGRQALLLRKGGLADRTGFALEANHFFLLPTFFHQQLEFVEPEHAIDVEGAEAQQPAGLLRFNSYAVVHLALPVESREALECLDGLHIWNHRFLDQRLAWKPHTPAWVLVLRVYRLAQPVEVPELPRYRGCRSWVNLAEPAPVEIAGPVLSDVQFEASVREIESALKGVASRG